jgi:hypothetical protein
MMDALITWSSLPTGSPVAQVSYAGSLMGPTGSPGPTAPRSPAVRARRSTTTHASEHSVPTSGPHYPAERGVRVTTGAGRVHCGADPLGIRQQRETPRG